MSDLFGKVTEDQDVIRKLLSKVPGFSGYFERQNRRAADKMMREVIANRYEEQWKRISEVQRELISQGEIRYVDDMENAAIKVRQFIDRVRTAAYGYAGFFDAVKVNQEELAQIYQYDLALLDAVEELKRGVDNAEASIGTDGLPAAIRHLTSLGQQAVETFNRRSEVILGNTSAAQA
ncbi:MAG: hypothetical protein GYA17_04850 [Chloroflexi bacterium]|nr:hypothetical protein [Anaerolineaceae bacterium]NMB87662.1 hypothetical protein [Chloroflexota bacterium]